MFPELQQEKEDAERIKRKENIVVVIGNPPYNGFAGVGIGEEGDLVMPYRAFVQGLTPPQGQGLNDLYIRFFRIAERKIVGDKDVAGSADGGIVSFISNNAWLDGLSHTTMRHHYLQSFQQIYIDNLNGDKYRTGKTTPEGKPDPSAFSTAQNREGIQVGTAIATLVRNTAKPGSQPKIRDLWGAGKRSHLERESRREGEPVYTELMPVAALGNPLAYRVHSAAYTGWPKLPELFPVYSPGLTTSTDALVIDIDDEVLETRMKLYYSTSVKKEELQLRVTSALFKRTKFDHDDVRGKLQTKKFRLWQIRRYLNRPFDLRWIYWEPSEGLIDRERTPLMAEIRSNNLLIEARQTEAGDEFCRGTISRSLPDHFGNGPSSFFPHAILSQGEGIFQEITEHPNTTRNACQKVEEIGGDCSDLFFHAIAIMHTPQYRTENAGALLGDWPQIPLPGTAELLARSAGLGRRLAELLDAESKVKLGKEWSFLARLRLPDFSKIKPDEREQAKADALRLTAGWGSRGQGSTVMPGRGKVAARAWTAEERGKLTALAAGPDRRRGLTLDEAMGLLGEGCVDVYLNGGSCWAGVPAKVWSYTLGGYQVLKKWLSYREGALLGRALREDEAAWFAEVARRIAGILLMGPELDASYWAILPGAVGLGNADSLRE